MDLKDLHPAGAVGRLDRHPPVEASGPEKRRIQDLGPVGRAENDDGLGGLEAVHLGKDLIEGLLPLIVGTRDTCRALARASDGVQLIDEDDRRGGLLGLREQVTHTGRADADDRLDELGGRDREESGVSLAGDRARQQCLPGPRSTEQQHPVGHPPAKPCVAVGALQKVDYLRKLGLGLIDPRDVVERDADTLRIGTPGLRSAEASQGPHPAAGARPPRQPVKERDQQQRRAEPQQDLGHHRGAGIWILGVDLNALGLKQRCERVVVPERRDLG